MKRIIMTLAVVALATILLLGLTLAHTGCGGGGGRSSVKSNSPVTEATAPETRSSAPGSSPGGAEAVVLADGAVTLDASVFDDNRAHFFSTAIPASASSPGSKTIRFLVVRDSAGVYRAAADACQVCYQAGKGYRQEAGIVVCNNCGNSYPFERIATEKGGCNPGPINPNLQVTDGKVTISQAELEQVAGLF